MIDRVQLGEIDKSDDGPTWNHCNRLLGLFWKTPGGDALLETRMREAKSGFDGPVTFEAAEIVRKLLTEGNTGIRIRPDTSGVAPKYWTRTAIADDGSTRVTDKGATLRVVTDQGTFDCPCDKDCFIDPQTTQTIGGDDGKSTMRHALLRFDLSAVRGEVQSALLTVQIRRYGGPVMYAGWLDMPYLITDPMRQFPDQIRTGIAAQYDNDADLASHPSTWNYVECKSVQSVVSRFNQVSTNYSTVNGVAIGCYDPEFVVNEFGMPTMRIVSRSLLNLPRPSDPSSGTAIANMYAFTTPSSKKLSYERPFGSGPEEMYTRYLLRIDPEYLTNSQEGIKLPGLDGGFYAETNKTEITAADVGGFSSRMEHGMASKVNPGCTSYITYWYGPDKPDGVIGTVKKVEIGVRDDVSDRGGAWRSIGSLKVGQWHCLEQHIRLNTINADGTPNSDGLFEMWLDGMLVYRQTNVMARGSKRMQIHTVPWFETMHGGSKPPLRPIHWDYSGIVAATEYIGPPKAMLTAKLGTPPTEEPPPEEPPTEEPPTGDDMADLDSIIAKTTDALNEAYAVKGQPSVAQQLTDAQAALAAANTAKAQAETALAAANAKIAAARSAAQADKDADAANVAGQGVLDALA